MTTVLTIMDRREWGAQTDNIVVADPRERELLWVPRDLWCERFGNRINKVFARERHQGMLRSLAEQGIEVDHSLCVRREAVEATVADLVITVPVPERLVFWYPLDPQEPIEDGRKLVTFDPPRVSLAGERIHQWVGARYVPKGTRQPLLLTGDFERIRRQQVLLRRALESGFEFAAALADPDLITASGPEAIEELSSVDPSWRFSVLDDVRPVTRDDKSVLERTGRPQASVIVLSYNSRSRIDTTIAALLDQELERPYEVIVVDSGSDGCADYVRARYPEVRVVRSRTRLWPGAARNRGLRAAQGEFVAFLADDCAPRPGWLRRRAELHQRGFELVGGAVVSGTPGSPVGSAAYLLEYSALLPSERSLRRQRVPHSLSYSRSLLDRVGEFPEDIRTGEDTVYNRRCLRSGATVAFDPEAQIAHRDPTGLRAFLRHQHAHGRGLAQCAQRHRLDTPAVHTRGAHLAFLSAYVRYPVARWWSALVRVARGRPGSLPAYLALSPLVWAGLWATAAGVWSQRRTTQRRAPAQEAVLTAAAGSEDATTRDPGPRSATNGQQPEISVVVCSYRSRDRIDHALGSLRRQDLEEPWEVVVVDSGDDGAAEYVAGAYPEARLVRSSRRLYPAAARNEGVRAARGRFVAFLPDDGVADPDWLSRRLRRHREGNAAVGGAITNGTPFHPVGTAAYYVEYSALLPSERILRQQRIPHCLSYERGLLQRLGGFPEGLETGEDTHLNASLSRARAGLALDPEIRMAHVNLTSLRQYLRHLYEHGYGFGVAAGGYGPAPTWMDRSGEARAAARLLLRYPLGRWIAALRRIAIGRPRSLPVYLALTPLVWAGLWAAAIGRWAAWRAGTTAARPRAAPRG